MMGTQTVCVCVCVYVWVCRRFLTFWAKFKAEFLERAAGCSVIKDWSFAPIQAAHMASYVCAQISSFSPTYPCALRKGSFDCVLVCVLLLWLPCFSLDFATRSSKQTYKTIVRDILLEFTLCSVSVCDFTCLFVVERRHKHITWCKIRRMFHSDLKGKKLKRLLKLRLVL